MDDLKKEREVFEMHIAEWRSAHLGEFVLIKGDEVVGFFRDLNEAFNEGLKRYGLDDFLVAEIRDRAVNVSFMGQHVRENDQFQHMRAHLRSRNNWLSALYGYVGAGDYDLALDAMFERFHDAFDSGHHDDADCILDAIDVHKLDGHTLVGLLTSTYRARGLLKKRPKIVQAVRRELLARGEALASVEQVLSGLT